MSDSDEEPARPVVENGSQVETMEVDSQTATKRRKVNLTLLTFVIVFVAYLFARLELHVLSLPPFKPCLHCIRF